MLYLSRIFTLTSITAGSYEDNEANEEVLVEMKGNEEEEEELSPEMIAFYKTTIEHREERNYLIKLYIIL